MNDYQQELAEEYAREMIQEMQDEIQEDTNSLEEKLELAELLHDDYLEAEVTGN